MLACTSSELLWPQILFYCCLALIDFKYLRSRSQGETLSFLALFLSLVSYVQEEISNPKISSSWYVNKLYFIKNLSSYFLLAAKRRTLKLKSYKLQALNVFKTSKTRIFPLKSTLLFGVQPAFICSKSIMETPEQYVKSVQS